MARLASKPWSPESTVTGWKKIKGVQSSCLASNLPDRSAVCCMKPLATQCLSTGSPHEVEVTLGATGHFHAPPGLVPKLSYLLSNNTHLFFRSQHRILRVLYSSASFTSFPFPGNVPAPPRTPATNRPPEIGFSVLAARTACPHEARFNCTLCEEDRS